MGFRLNKSTKEILITRGDTGRARFTINFDGTPYEMQEGDHIDFGIKANYKDGTCLIKKSYTENPFVLSIEPGDTKALEFRSYYWDMQFVSASGFVRTFIAKKAFTVTEEVVNDG